MLFECGENEKTMNVFVILRLDVRNDGIYAAVHDRQTGYGKTKERNVPRSQDHVLDILSAE